MTDIFSDADSPNVGASETDLSLYSEEPDEKNKVEDGVLYLVTTPIGNLADLSPRARKILCEVTFIAAEDTRNTRRLLTCFGIHKETVSYHEHNKAACGPRLCDRLTGGDSCALVTDAGMPAISDPGEDLVRLCAERGIRVVAVPGPCAAPTALSLSALSSGRFAFEGFLPAVRGARAKRLAEIRAEERTLVIYEAPHRLTQTLRDLSETFGEDRRVSLCRELTKRNEETVRTTLGSAIALCEEKPPRGEYVLVVEGAAEWRSRTGTVKAPESADAEETPLSPAAHVAFYEAQGMSHKDAIKAAATSRGMTKSAFYQLLILEKG